MSIINLIAIHDMGLLSFLCVPLHNGGAGGDGGARVAHGTVMCLNRTH